MENNIFEELVKIQSLVNEEAIIKEKCILI
jgi:hypothetical protein